MNTNVLNSLDNINNVLYRLKSINLMLLNPKIDNLDPDELLATMFLTSDIISDCISLLDERGEDS